MSELAQPLPPMIECVNRLEQEAIKYPQVECPVWNFFAPGLYARKMFIPKGTILVGAVHKTEHLCIVSGVIDVTVDEAVVRIADMHRIFTSKPGAKRAGCALEDTYWTTVHATTETDLDKLVEELVEATSQQLLGGDENTQLICNRLKEE